MSKKNWIILLVVVIAGLLIICCILAIIFGSWGDKTRTEKPAVEAPKPDTEPGGRTEEPAVEAPEPDMAPSERRINGDKWIGCVNKDEYKRLIGYAVDKDEEAFGKALLVGLANGTSTMFEDGETVYLEDTGFLSGLIQVRRKGEHVRYWTAVEAVSR
jgi:hypothetical protein